MSDPFMCEYCGGWVDHLPGSEECPNREKVAAVEQSDTPLVAETDAGVIAELVDALKWALEKEPSPCRCLPLATPPHVCVAHKALLSAEKLLQAGKTYRTGWVIIHPDGWCELDYFYHSLTSSLDKMGRPITVTPEEWVAKWRPGCRLRRYKFVIAKDNTVDKPTT